MAIRKRGITSKDPSMIRLAAAISALAMLACTPAMAGDSGLKVSNTIKIGGAGGWDYDNFDPVLRRLYVTHGASIAAVDIATGAVTTHLAEANGAHIALPLDGGRTLLLTQGKTNTASFIDALTGADLGDIATAGKPDGAIFDPATGHVFVLDNEGGEIDVLDPQKRTLIGKIMVAGAPESGAADADGLLYTHLEDKNAIVVIDTRAMTIKATYAMPDCEGPSGLALIKDQRLLLSACDGHARVTNADTGAEVALLPTGDRSDGALYDDKTKQGYIPCGDGTLTVISFDGTPHVIDVVTTKPGARTAALDTDTGTLYLPTADLGPVDPATHRPAIVPDTFAVLVVAK